MMTMFRFHRRGPGWTLAALVLMIAGLVAGSLTSGCGRGSGSAGGGESAPGDRVIARVGDYQITSRELQQRLENQFPELAGSFSARSEQAIRNLITKDLDALCLVAEAERVGFADSSYAYKQALEEGRRRLLSRYFTEHVVYPAAAPSDEELREVYETRKETYKVTEKRVIRHILVNTRAEAEAALAQVEAGEPFASVASRLTLDEESRISGGSVGYVEPGQPVRGLGMVPEFVDAAMQMRENETRIIKTDHGWHVLLCARVIEEGYRPFEEVRDELYESELRVRTTIALNDELQLLRGRYGVRVYDENLASFLAERRAKPESELFAEAQSETDPAKRIEIYRSYLKQFPHSEHACEARFLIGFTYAEELKDRNHARMELNDFMKECPESELAESARYMLDELSRAR